MCHGCTALGSGWKLFEMKWRRVVNTKSDIFTLWGKKWEKRRKNIRETSQHHWRGEGWLWKWKKNLQSVTSTGKHVLLRVRFENFSTADADELPSNVRIEKWHHVQLQFYQMSDSPQREPNDDYFRGFQRSKITQVHPLHAEFSLIQTKSYNQYQRRWLGIVSFPSH